MWRQAFTICGLAALAGCAPAHDPPDAGAPFTPSYLGVETRLLENDLVAFDVKMRGARWNGDVAAYGECAAAQYALIRGYGFARHVRTVVEKDGSLWRGAAVYVISASLPDGLQKIDAEVAVANCAEEGIPTV